MKKLRIGYAPNSPDLKHPADRRRIVYWADKRGHEIVLDIDKRCDVLFLSGRADFIGLSKQINRQPMILDLVDGYLGEEEFWRDWLRGAGKVLSKQISGRIQSYRRFIRDTCSKADAVLCETVEQVQTILPYCGNVHSILDFHEEFPKLPFNRNLQTKNLPAVMWEGLPFTARGLLLLEKAFSEIAKSHPISLEMVTDLNYPRFLGNYFYQNTEKLLQHVPETLGKNFKLTEWNLSAVFDAANRSHMAVLPLDPHGTLNPLKAENRLLMMWRIGLPVLASPSLAYKRVMKATGIDGICNSPEEWQEKILALMDSTKSRQESVERGQQYIQETHSERIVLEAWDRLFESVL